MSDLKDQNDSLEKNQPTKAQASGIESVAIVVESSNSADVSVQDTSKAKANAPEQKPKEINGPKGLEPTRYGDWESKGRCYDF